MKSTEIKPLSEREKQVLIMISEGMKSDQIATILELSVHTVFNHRKKMLKKTGCKNVGELVVFGIRNGIIV